MDRELNDAKSRLAAIEREIGELDVHRRVVESMNARAEFLTEQIVNALEGKPVEPTERVVPYFVRSHT